MSFGLSKKFRFEAAHRLAKGYEGKCANIHGHSWNGELQLTSKGSGLDKHGMALDFADMTAFLKTIEDELDHAMLICSTDTPILELCSKQGYKIAVFKDNPTSEVVARYVYERAKHHFEKENSRIKVSCVLIKETCTSSCKYWEP